MQQVATACTWCGAAVQPDPRGGKAPWLCPTCDHDHERDAGRPPVDGPKEAHDQ